MYQILSVTHIHNIYIKICIFYITQKCWGSMVHISWCLKPHVYCNIRIYCICTFTQYWAMGLNVLLSRPIFLGKTTFYLIQMSSWGVFLFAMYTDKLCRLLGKSLFGEPEKGISKTCSSRTASDFRLGQSLDFHCSWFWLKKKTQQLELGWGTCVEWNLGWKKPSKRVHSGKLT